MVGITKEEFKKAWEDAVGRREDAITALLKADLELRKMTFIKLGVNPDIIKDVDLIK